MNDKEDAMRTLVYVMITLLLSSCATYHYAKTRPGELNGRLTVEWIEPDEFIFRPDPDNPLTFTRYNKDKITPGLMYTDGGSIPRPLWALRSYSPWGYAPAFIVHDWLFHMRHCQLPGNEKFTVDEAAWVMSEVMKTMMEKEGVDKFTLYTMFEAVRSPLAKNLWDKRECEELPLQKRGLKPKMHYVIEFP
jgi:hypothetical protein